MHYLSFKFVCSWVLYWFGFLKLWSVCFVHVWFNLLKKTDHLSSFYELEYECILTYFLFREVFIAHNVKQVLAFNLYFSNPRFFKTFQQYASSTKGVSMHLASKSEPPSKSKTASQKEEMEKIYLCGLSFENGRFWENR